MKKQVINSVVYKTDSGNIQVAVHYSEHKNFWYVQGSMHGKLETGGGSSIASTIKLCIKKFIQDNDLKMNGKISHSIYGIYSVDVS